MTNIEPSEMARRIAHAVRLIPKRGFNLIAVNVGAATVEEQLRMVDHFESREHAEAAQQARTDETHIFDPEMRRGGVPALGKWASIDPRTVAMADEPSDD